MWPVQFTTATCHNIGLLILDTSDARPAGRDQGQSFFLLYFNNGSSVRCVGRLRTGGRAKVAAKGT